jgi:23S rRNA (cytosine1962-C5)-methyltransferase
VAGWAHIEGSPRLAARVWAAGPLAETEIATVESRVARALARRRSLLSGSAAESEGATNAYRLIHGEADGLPGLIVDRLGPLLRVLVTGRSTEGFRAHALDALRGQLPCSPEGQPWCVLEVQNLRQTGPVVFDAVRWLEGELATLDTLGAERRDSDLCVEERGLRFWVDPGWGAPRRPRPGFGLFLDQRENRARLAARAAAGGRWLNLFSHTGAFSASLLAAGASVVESLDLSAPYLARLEANLASNRDRGVDPARHRSIRSDVRRYLETLDDERTFAGIVLDPPTAAAAGRRFWSVRQDLEPLLGLCVCRLDAGGSLLVTQNRRGPPLGLDRILERVASRAHRRLAGLEPAPAGSDHPSLAGFPEGDAFEGWLLSLD